MNQLSDYNPREVLGLCIFLGFLAMSGLVVVYSVGVNAGRHDARMIEARP